MTKEERCLLTKKYQEMGLNCAQCVLLSFRDLVGLTEEQCFGIGSAFGGGIRCGGLCGSVSGSAMVLGLLYPQTSENGKEGKARITRLTVEFQRRFKEQFRYLNCRELLSDPPAKGTPMAQKLGITEHCRIMEVSAVELLCDYLAELQ